MPINNGILNQKGTPAFYSDIFANRPAFGYAGRVFISTDTGAIYEDTGSAWTLIADAGAGTTGTLQQVTTNGNTTTQGLVITTGNLAIGTSTASAPLDIHEGTLGQLIQLNATSTNNSNIAFLNGNVGKWRIGNVYNAGANDFNIFNIGTSSNALSFNSTTNAATFISSVQATSFKVINAPVTTTFTETGLAFQGIGGSVSILNVWNTADAGNVLIKSGTSSPNISSILVTGNFADPTNPNTNPGTIIFTTLSTERMRLNSTGLSVTGTGSYSGLLTTSAGITFPVGQSISSNSGRIILNNGSIYMGDVDNINPTGAVIIRQAGNNFIAYNSSLLNITGTVNISTLGTGTVTATSGTLSTVSDMNLKIDAGYIDNALNKVMNLKPRYFHWKKESGLPTDLRQLGFYAQEVNIALGEEAANTPSDKNIPFGINDRSIIAFLTKAIQELNEKLVRNNIN